MRTLYIFKLNKTYSSIASKKPKSIYIIFKSIYLYDKKSIIVAFDLFDEVCMPINVEFLNKYIYDKMKSREEYTKFKNNHMYHNFFTNEESKLSINKSHLKIKSNTYDNVFINNIREFTNLFVCDFMYDNYEYLKKSDTVKKSK